ncbi:alcohol dehydrogenase catalytic domain-containing protein [Micromonospora sp. NPDC049301]|uniref:alcohol dehydrogenase catalytic domain-containing protein n=1 Tax=Micromonospora sp. NPDC049301 TaxID=3155723 RepID=UPI0034202F7D
MRAVVYEGVRAVGVREVPDARLEAETDALVRVTSSALCGTDLHIYDGRTGGAPAWCSGTNRWAWSSRWVARCRASGRACGW